MLTTSDKGRLERIQILIVVSSPSAADLIKRMFMELGFTTVRTAMSTAEAIQIMRQLRIDLIVTDCEIKPGTDAELHKLKIPARAQLELTGIHFVERLRRSPASPNPYLPVVMLMSHASGQIVLSARDAGVNEIIIKPMDAPDFCSRIIAVVDQPRNFVTAPTYKGPCRRRKTNGVAPPGKKERRTREIRILRSDEIHVA